MEGGVGFPFRSSTLEGGKKTRDGMTSQGYRTLRLCVPALESSVESVSVC